jgi:flagellar biosynthesis protein
LPADDKPLQSNLKPLPPTSDAVAVALAHERAGDHAPKVVAGGRGRVAEQILQVAFEHGVKVREDADLAQLLSAIDINDEIPLEAFAAVAEILVYVYQANDGRTDPESSVSELARDMSEKWAEDRKSAGAEQ